MMSSAIVSAQPGAYRSLGDELVRHWALIFGLWGHRLACAVVRILEPVRYTSSKGATMAETVRDPVCGMEIDPATAAGKSEYKGQTYYFCSPGCKRSFEKDPEKYLGASTQIHQH